MIRACRPGPGLLPLLILLTACASSCRIGTGIVDTGEEPYRMEPAEDFGDRDRPVYRDFDDGTRNYRLLYPWNYSKAHNTSRHYPLVVSLHGSGGDHYAPCIVNDDREMQDHPCFFLSPTCPNWRSDSAWVLDLIEELIVQYRIDRNRLYVMGFSMGGSGTFSIAKAYYAEKRGVFAGIVRLAGQSEETLPDALADRTSVWCHVGLLDDEIRVISAENIFRFFRDYPRNRSAKEHVVQDELGSYPRTTKVLVKDGIGIMKESEYEGMGHDGGTAFSDPAVLDWLFSQSLENR